MKPLSERADDDLRFLLVYAAGVPLGVKEEAVAELIRRERERCAEEIDRIDAACGPPSMPRPDFRLKDIAGIIRGLS